MNNRLQLHEQLVAILGNNNAYFQPPASVHIVYPCVIYNIGNGDVKYANNSVYSYTHSYDVTFIFKKPNTDIIEEVLTAIPMSSLERVYVADNLNHYVFRIFK